MFKKIISFVPGFRTGRLWKKIIASLTYPVLIFAIIASIIGSNDPSVSSMDNSISRWESVAVIIFFIVIPFVLITNTGKVRSKLPLFKNGNILKKTIAWIISFIFLFIGFGVLNSFLSNLHSPEYIAMQQKIREERAKKDAEEKAKKNAEKLALQEEKAKKEAEAKAKKEAENKAQQEAKAPDVKDETPDKPVTTVEKADVPDEQSQLSDNPKTSITKAVSGWFSGLFNRPKTDEKQEKATVAAVKRDKKTVEQYKKELKNRENQRFSLMLRTKQHAFFDYEKSLRFPDDNKDGRVRVSGKVLQVISETDKKATLAINVGNDDLNAKEVIATYDKEDSSMRILEKDHVTVWGFYRGLKPFQRITKQEVNLPYIEGYSIKADAGRNNFNKDDATKLFSIMFDKTLKGGASVSYNLNKDFLEATITNPASNVSKQFFISLNGGTIHPADYIDYYQGRAEGSIDYQPSIIESSSLDGYYIPQQSKEGIFIEKLDNQLNSVWKMKISDYPTSTVSSLKSSVAGTLFIIVDGNIYCLNEDTGEFVYKGTNVGKDSNQFITSDDGEVFVINYEKPHVLAVDAKGAVKWKQDSNNDNSFPQEIFWNPGEKEIAVRFIRTDDVKAKPFVLTFKKSDGQRVTN